MLQEVSLAFLYPAESHPQPHLLAYLESTALVPRVSFAATRLSRDPYRIMCEDEENYIRLIPVLIITLTPWMGRCFPHMFHLFHVSIRERASRKRLERGGPLKKQKQNGVKVIGRHESFKHHLLEAALIRLYVREAQTWHEVSTNIPPSEVGIKSGWGRSGACV